MPDGEGNPTELETLNALGWDAVPEGDEPVDGLEGAGSEPAPAPIAAGPEPAPQLVTQAPGPAPEPVTAAPQPYVPPVLQPDPMQAARDAENARLREDAAFNDIRQKAQTHMNSLMDQGWDQNHAWQAAEQFAQSEKKTYEFNSLRQVANEQAKNAKALELAQQYGVPVQTLQAYDSPAAMEQTAKNYQETTGRINQLQQQVNSQSRAPVQQFDSNNMSSSNTTSAMQLRYATDPNFNPTDEQFAQMGLS